MNGDKKRYHHKRFFVAIDKEGMCTGRYWSASIHVALQRLWLDLPTSDHDYMNIPSL
jgi:hypothetical protein